MSQRKIPARELIGFIVRVRHLAFQEADEKKALQLIRNQANRMFLNHVGYDHRGDYRIKARGESSFAASVEARKAYQQRWGSVGARDGPVRICFYGHSAVGVTGTRTVLFDPFLDGNPAHAGKLSKESIRQADIVCVTQSHPHHLGDAVAICARTGARLVGTPELMASLPQDGPAVHAEVLNVGGQISLDGIDVIMTDARHVTRGPAAVGYLVKLDGYGIFHPGDTGLCEEMRWLGEQHDIDVAFLPIGGRHTMGVHDAARAAALLRPRYVVPVHYNTYPEIQADVEEFIYTVAETTEVKVLTPGESLVMDRAQADGPGDTAIRNDEQESIGDSGEADGTEPSPVPALGGRFRNAKA